MQRIYTDLSPTASSLSNSENTSISVRTSKLQEIFDFQTGQRGVCIQTTGSFPVDETVVSSMASSIFTFSSADQIDVDNCVPRFLGSQRVERVARKLKKKGDCAIFHPLPDLSHQSDFPINLSSHMAYRDGSGRFFVWPIERLVSLLNTEKLKAFEREEYRG